MAKRTARAGLNRERVLKAALALADAQGLEALTMRKLAQALGVEAMSLYNHVGGKEDVLDGILDLVAGEFARPRADGDWQAEMRARAMSMHQVLMRHRWAPLLMVSRVTTGPGMLGHVEATLACLHAAGFSYPMADHAWNAVDAHVYGFTLKAITFPFDEAEYAAAARAYLPQIPAETYPHLRALSEQVASGAHDGVNALEFGLDLILDGLATLPRPR